MAENGTEFSKIAWSQAFPFVRLFRTLHLALDFNRLVLALACVLVIYMGGRVLDAAWGDGGAVATITIGDFSQTEIEVYAGGDQAGFNEWQRGASQLQERSEALAGDGPFIALAKFEARCFAAAIQGVCTGHWGFSGAAAGPEPAMMGSVVSAWRGAAWLVTQRPWFALLYGVFHLLVFAYFGGAICRSAAVQAARDESIGAGAALRFAGEKYGGLIMAPLLPILIFLIIGVVMAIGGLVSGVIIMIPYLGAVMSGLAYVLAILGGFALAVILLATVLGFHLMWPTIAVEGSDGFDALSRACSYVGSRIWHVGFYSFVLLLYGALSFVLVRLVILLTLKLTHTVTGIGMNVIGASQREDWGKLDVMWQMPAWADLTLLPTASSIPIYGSLFNGELSGTETVGAFIIAIWVFLLVGLLVAFAISFFFCGSTQMYFLLRRDVDATDWDEVYYVEPEDDFPMPTADETVPGATDEPTPPEESPASPPAEQEKPADDSDATPPEEQTGGS